MLEWGYSTKAQIIKSKVFDLFWIPCFPFSAQYAPGCPTCGTHYDISR
jgi:hypothetical protein